MSVESYKEILSSLALPSISLGYTTVHIYKVHELEKAQIGYAIAPNGNILAGKDDGSWKEEWLIIGYEDLCGDPLFIDTKIEDYPVYTAVHGEGEWRPKQIATNLTGFAKAISAIATIAKGRENPVQLEANPIPPEERQHVLEKIQIENPDIDLEFWHLWLGE